MKDTTCQTNEQGSKTLKMFFSLIYKNRLNIFTPPWVNGEHSCERSRDKSTINCFPNFTLIQLQVTYLKVTNLTTWLLCKTLYPDDLISLKITFLPMCATLQWHQVIRIPTIFLFFGRRSWWTTQLLRFNFGSIPLIFISLFLSVYGFKRPKPSFKVLLLFSI